MGGILISCSSSFPEKGFSSNLSVILLPLIGSSLGLEEEGRRVIGGVEGGVELGMAGSALFPHLVSAHL